MNSVDFRHGNSKHPKRICIPQVLLYCKRKLNNIICAADVARLHACGDHFFTVMRDIVIYPVNKLLQTSRLQNFNFFTGHAFEMFIPIFHTLNPF